MDDCDILIAEARYVISSTLCDYFQSRGYKVTVVERGEDALKICWQRSVQIILLGTMLMDMDSYQVCMRIRTNLRTRHIPIILVAPEYRRADLLHGLELGADDYIAIGKNASCDLAQLRQVVQNLLARSRLLSRLDPVTQLPGSRMTTEMLTALLFDEHWAVLCIGINNFGLFKELYGFIAGWDVLRFVAGVLIESVSELRTRHDFVGHIGGDDFIVASGRCSAGSMVKQLKQRFDGKWTFEWWRNEILRHEASSGTDGVSMSLSIGMVTDDDGPFGTIWDVMDAAARARRKLRLFSPMRSDAAVNSPQISGEPNELE